MLVFSLGFKELCYLSGLYCSFRNGVLVTDGGIYLSGLYFSFGNGVLVRVVLCLYTQVSMR